jgi:hypothetical protein
VSALFSGHTLFSIGSAFGCITNVYQGKVYRQVAHRQIPCAFARRPKREGMDMGSGSKVIRDLFYRIFHSNWHVHLRLDSISFCAVDSTGYWDGGESLLHLVLDFPELMGNRH